MITIASLLWDKNESSQGFSQMYDERWVKRLYAGFERNLSVPWRFVLFTDKDRDLPKVIVQERMKATRPTYADCIEPYRFGVPMILVGLDTVVTGPVNHLAQYCIESETIALPRDPYNLERACNGVALIPPGHQDVYRNWKGENDMDWMRKQPHRFIDDLFPGQVVSYKGSVRKNGLGDARIVYFHGDQKPHQLKTEPWIRKHWLGENG